MKDEYRYLFGPARVPFPAVLLSNGTFFRLPEVRKAAIRADSVKLYLSVWDQKSFQSINRPHRAIDFEKFARIILNLKPDNIHLNAAVRPPAEEYSK